MKRKTNLNLCRKRRSKARLDRDKLNNNLNFCRITSEVVHDENFTPAKLKQHNYEKKSQSKRTLILTPRIKKFSTPSKSPAKKKYRISVSPVQKFEKAKSDVTSEADVEELEIKAGKLTYPSSNRDKEEEVNDLSSETLFNSASGSSVVRNVHHSANLNETAEAKIKQRKFKPSRLTYTQANEEKDKNSLNTDLQEMMKMIPYVLDLLHKNGLPNVFLMFFRQTHDNPDIINNLAFLLWAEVVRWFHQKSSVTMRYMDQTKMFWKLGWQLFGGKFLRFMSGFKNESQLVSGEAQKGMYSPPESDVNFAVPSIQVLREFKPYGGDLKGVRAPGIFDDVIEKICPALVHTSCCLTFDGKKLKQGLTSSSGDVDILGFEEGPSLKDRLFEVRQELEKQQAVLDSLYLVQENSQQEQDLDLIRDIKQKYKLLSTYIQEMKALKEKKQYALKKFMERGGNDWRQSKFVYVISALQAFIYDIDCFLSNADNLLSIMCQELVRLQKSEKTYVSSSIASVKKQDNLIELLDDPNNGDDPRKVKQRSVRWFDIRNEAKVTGSTIYKAIGLDGLNKLRQHFEKVICGIEEPIPTDFVQKAMEHGSKNEINAIITLVTKVLPSFMPELEYQEEGCVIMYDSEGKIFMVVSPDGSLREVSPDKYHCKNVIAAIEIKCPINKVHTEVPERYYLQCMAEIEALGVEYLIYVSWTKQTCNVFKLKRNSYVLHKALKLASSIYGVENPKRPTKLNRDMLNEIRNEIRTNVKQAEYIGEFKSTFVEENDKSEDHMDTQNSTVNMSTVEMYETLMALTRQRYELQRQKATEALVFLCCDLDRMWSKDRLMWSPVCWCPKGYSLTTEVVRNLMEEVLDRCYKAGIHIPCSSFYGQWHNITVRSKEGKPLTILQLQKDLWKETQGKPANEMLSSLKQIDNTPQWRWETELTQVNGKYVNGKKVVCSNGGQLLPKTSSRGWTIKKAYQMKAVNKDNDNTIDIPDMTEIVSENVIKSATGESSEISILQCQFDAEVAQEIATCNIQDDDWAEVLQDMQMEDDIDTHSDVHVEGENDVVRDMDGVKMSAVISEEGGGKEIESLTKTIKLNDADFTSILSLLKSDKNANSMGKWDKKVESDIALLVHNKSALEGVRDVDVRVIARYLRKVKGLKIKEYATKANKIENICEVLGITSCRENTFVQKVSSSKKTYSVKSLASLAFDTVKKKVPKQVLNVAYAEYEWPSRLETWKGNSFVSHDMKVDHTDEPEFWFYVQEYAMSRHQIEVKCIDSTHLLTRTRRKTCHGGIEGLENKPWLKVAKQGQTLLTPVMVEDITDSMSMSMAVTHFSKPVQKAMRINGDFQAASLSECIHDWWRAEDDPGIEAIERVRLRSKLRRRLLSNVRFDQFPPPGSYVKGWPCQLWEALVAGIDAKALLYTLTKSKTYNTRAFSSMMGETFFAELTNQDKGSHGTVTAEEFGRYISRTIEQMQMRLDKTRTFVYRTSAVASYRLVDQFDVASHELVFDSSINQTEREADNVQTHVSAISPRNHFFDTEDRKRIKGRKREGTVSKERNAVQKGSLGVRWEHARRNEQKILPSKRMGIDFT